LFFQSPARRLFTQLAKKKRMLVTAESLTGGLLGAEITAIPGSSLIFWGGVVSYSNQAKHRLLGVDESILETAGSVSAPVAEAMATGALGLCENALALSVTGFAGPTGGTKNLPVGSVWIAASVKARDNQVVCVSHLYQFSGSRTAIRRKTLKAAFKVALELLDRQGTV